MNQTEALQRLLQLGAGNHKEISTALLAIKQRSPIAHIRVLRALNHGRADLQLGPGDEPEMLDIIADLARHQKRGRLPDGTLARDRQIQGRVTDARKTHWNNYAREHGLTLWGLIEEVLDQRTGYREE